MIPQIVPSPVVKECRGCPRVEAGFCRAYAYPDHKWSQGWCNHNDIPQDKQPQAIKVLNPLKASKLSAKGKLTLRKYKHTRQFSKKRYVDYLEVKGEQGGKRKR